MPFDLLKRQAAQVGIENLGMQYVRFFADETGMPKLKDAQGNLVDFRGPQGVQGATGATGPQGPQGEKGWSPVLANVADGERRVLRVVDYVGGAGAKPAVPTDNYIGPTGFTNLAGATDIRGATGAQGPQGIQGPAGQSVAVSDEGTQLTATATSLNFTGTGVTATNSGNAVTVNIPGNPAASAAAPPAVAAAGAVGTSADYARADHTHQGVTSLSFNGGTATSGAVSFTESPAFATVAVTGQNSVVANDRNGTLTLVAGTNISLTTSDVADSITINSTSVATNGFGVITGNTGTATADTPTDTLAITGGTGISTAATDTPDGLVITNTGVTSVNGQTGAVTIPIHNSVTRTAPTASASTALTTIQSYPVATGEVTAGSEYEFYASLRVINTTTATNAVVTLSVGATNVLVLTQAIGATAAAAPGAAVDIYGRITFYSATAAEACIRASKQAAVAFDAVANTSASVTVAAATATTIDLKFNTSGATSTFIARQATIRRIK